MMEVGLEHIWKGWDLSVLSRELWHMETLLVGHRDAWGHEWAIGTGPWGLGNVSEGQRAWSRLGTHMGSGQDHWLGLGDMDQG